MLNAHTKHKLSKTHRFYFHSNGHFHGSCHCSVFQIYKYPVSLCLWQNAALLDLVRKHPPPAKRFHFLPQTVSFVLFCLFVLGRIPEKRLFNNFAQICMCAFSVFPKLNDGRCVSATVHTSWHMENEEKKENGKFA